MTSAVMHSLDAQTVGKVLNILNPPVTWILPHFLQPFVRSRHAVFIYDDTIYDVIVKMVRITRASLLTRIEGEAETSPSIVVLVNY